MESVESNVQKFRNYYQQRAGFADFRESMHRERWLGTGPCGAVWAVRPSSATVSLQTCPRIGLCRFRWTRRG
jgi:hypothetical protein